jgi:signal transduction histidine kinase
MQTLASAWDDIGRQLPDVPAPRSDGDDIRAVCHDLRGHLATIGMIASALRSDPALPEAADRRLGSLLDEVAVSTEMVRRVVTGKRDVTQVDLDVLARHCAERAAATALQPVGCKTEPVTVCADRLQLTRLVDNLIENAVRAAGPDGQVVVRVQRRVDLHDAARADGTSALALLTVEDSGPGFGNAEPGLASLGHRIARAVLAETGGTLELGRSDLGGGLVSVSLPARAR